MDKGSVILLQELDCNCNDCISLERDLERFQKSLADHKRWQLDYYNSVKSKLPKEEADRYKFQFDKKEVSINYGKCLKFNKDVSFIPNTIQLHTQDCFKHRRV